jgi:uncharacterized protein YdbL (DUF1318 family)
MGARAECLDRENHGAQPTKTFIAHSAASGHDIDKQRIIRGTAVSSLRNAATTLFTALVVSACVTINVYFPAVAAERAADRIINDVWGESPQQQPQTPPQHSPQSSAPGNASAHVTAFAMRTLSLIIPAAHAQPDFDISSPAIKSLTQSMEQRHSQLKSAYDVGAIGLTQQGLVEIRDQSAVPLQQRNTLRKLVADENTDRNALYREIALANQHPDWENDIRATFARRWIERAPKGWWYQDGSGNWKQK